LCLDGLFPIVALLTVEQGAGSAMKGALKTEILARTLSSTSAAATGAAAIRPYRREDCTEVNVPSGLSKTQHVSIGLCESVPGSRVLDFACRL